MVVTKKYGPTPKCKNPDCNNEAGYKSNGKQKVYCCKSCKLICQWSNPEFAKMVSRNSSIRMSNLHRDPVFAKAHSERRSEQFIKMNKSHDFRKSRSEAVSRLRLDPNSYISKNAFGNKGFHYSIKAGKVFYRSSYELSAYLLLDENPRVSTYKVEPYLIPYEDRNGNERNYCPDILIEYIDGSRELVEIKPDFFLRNLDIQIKLRAGEIFSENMGFKFSVWSDSNWPDLGA